MCLSTNFQKKHHGHTFTFSNWKHLLGGDMDSTWNGWRLYYFIYFRTKKIIYLKEAIAFISSLSNGFRTL
jgi:hypothetical protein